MLLPIGERGDLFISWPMLLIDRPSLMAIIHCTLYMNVEIYGALFGNVCDFDGLLKVDKASAFQMF